MESVRMRRWWRVWFYAMVAIIAPFTVPSALHIPDAERIVVICGWLAVALLYAALLWRTRPDGRDWWIQDALTILVFVLAALYQANWPNWRIPSTPALVGGLWAASGLGSSIGPARRWQPPERPAPPS
jgi:uncharacterized protein YhhL (DUF1145 family)